MDAPETEPFARDFGYLVKFFDGLDEHAAKLANAEAAARLRALLGEERGRWEEIRALLRGGAPAPHAKLAQPAATAPSERAASPAPVTRERWTVGTLRTRDR